ncbi:hypothetical protein QBC35DRAFT_452803 [Podospora australis]|uniref:Uncharacterized protein n=1 Tax=Podospora australis TaxID=1536484 RepID=A0AAN7AIJ5_9PEZI|nr:hypothetical protein QBC35DRAFT_452803 [Podospora australis]
MASRMREDRNAASPLSRRQFVLAECCPTVDLESRGEHHDVSDDRDTADWPVEELRAMDLAIQRPNDNDAMVEAFLHAIGGVSNIDTALDVAMDRRVRLAAVQRPNDNYAMVEAFLYAIGGPVVGGTKAGGSESIWRCRLFSVRTDRKLDLSQNGMKGAPSGPSNIDTALDVAMDRRVVSVSSATFQADSAAATTEEDPSFSDPSSMKKLERRASD